MEEEGSTAKMVMAQNPEQGPQVPAAQSRCVRAKLTSIMEVPGDRAPGFTHALSSLLCLPGPC